MFPKGGFPFTGDALLNWLRNDLPMDVWRSFSGRSILSDLRSAGASIRDAEFWNVRGQVLGVERFFANLERLAGETIVPRSWYVENHGRQLSQNFVYNFQVDADNNNTGLSETLFYSFSSNRELTVSDIMREIRRSLEAGTDETDWTVNSATMRFALARPGVFDQ